MKTITKAERGLAHVPGFLLFVRESALTARRFDERRLALTEEEFRVADGIPSCCGSWDPWSVSQTVLALWRNSFGYETVLRWYARDGTFTEAIGTPGRYSGIALSPKGDRIAFSRFVAGGARDIWVRDTERDTEVPLTFDGDSFSPVWSPNGNEIAFSSARGNVPDVYVTSATGGAGDQSRRSSASTLAVDVPGSWTPDGKHVLFTAETPGSPRLSPDGKWIASVTDASGRPEVWLAAYPSGEMRVAVSRDGGVAPEWKPGDGRELYYMSLDQRLMAVTVEPRGSGVSVSPPKQILRLPEMVPPSGIADVRSYVPSPDGRRFLVEVLAPGVRQPPLQVIVNWQALLKK